MKVGEALVREAIEASIGFFGGPTPPEAFIASEQRSSRTKVKTRWSAA